MSYLQALKELHAEGSRLYLNYEQISTDFGGFVRDLLSKADPTRLVPGKVLETVYWLVAEDTYIGRVSIRHALNADLRRHGGNIGYEIRPSKRRQGYGKEILRLGLIEARKIGLGEVLITCASNNTGSRKIIEANGGVFEDEIMLEDLETLARRYWINLQA